MWWFYADLKAYKRAPDRRRRHELRARFDRIFRRRTGFATLDRLLARLHANKEELLLVLERPEVPLHTNGSERDLRPQVVKRKISGGTRSEAGRQPSPSGECRLTMHDGDRMTPDVILGGAAYSLRWCGNIQASTFQCAALAGDATRYDFRAVSTSET